MRFEIDASVFTAENNVGLLSLLDRSSRGRLYISVTNPDSTYSTWLNTLPKPDQSLWQTMIDWADADAANRRVQIIRVEPIAASEWKLPEPRLTIVDALGLSDRSVELLVENGRNDRNFVLAMAGHKRDYLLALEAAGALEFSGAGGIGEMKALVRDQIVPRQDRAVRVFALFDSDGAIPGTVSIQAQSVIDTCTGASIQHHCLKRRTIENYLPIGALFDYAAKRSRADRLRMTKLASSIKAMNRDQRAHFPMKAGLPAAPSAAQATLYGNAMAVDRSLRAGFGDDLASSFEVDDNSRILTQVEADDAKEEVRNAIERILFLAGAPYA
jgi:hypothetical protein